MAIKLQIRRDTLTNWNANSSVVLLSGEIGYVTDTRNMKIGDGTTVWSSLNYQAPYYTGANSGAPNTLLALDVTNSRVGIGTTSPANKLQVDTTSLTADGFQVRNLNSTAYAQTILAGQTGVPASGVPANSVLIEGVPASTASTAISSYANSLVFQTNARTERMRIDSNGRVGIGTTSPANQLDVNGIVTSNRTTAGTFVTSGDGVYAFGSDIKQYIYGTPGNDGRVAIHTASGGTTAERFNVTSTVTEIKTPLTTTTTATIGGALTVSAGGLTVNTGTVSLPANSVSLGTVSQIAAGTFLGNSTGSTANVAAVTQAQARTMLGLVAPAYTGPANFNTAWTNLNLTTATAAAGLNLDVTSMTVGVINRIPIALGRSGGTGSGDVTCFATVESGEILLILGGYDTGSATPFSGSAGSGNTSLVWYWRNTVWTTGVAATSGGQNVSFLPMFAFAGAGTANILRLGDIANGSAQRVSADVIAMRLA